MPRGLVLSPSPRVLRALALRGAVSIGADAWSNRARHDTLVVAFVSGAGRVERHFHRKFQSPSWTLVRCVRTVCLVCVNVAG